jgi:hypothetical protein
MGAEAERKKNPGFSPAGGYTAPQSISQVYGPIVNKILAPLAIVLPREFRLPVLDQAFSEFYSLPSEADRLGRCTISSALAPL